MKKAGVLVSAIATTAVCASMIAGSTFALFTSESQVDITITSGKVSVTADISGTAYSAVDLPMEMPDDYVIDYNEGKAVVTENGVISLDKMLPGDKIELALNVVNTGTVAAKYQVKLECTEGVALMNQIKVSLGDEDLTANGGLKSYTSDWVSTEEEVAYNFTLTLPAGVGNEYQGLAASVKATVYAVQSNAHTENPESNVENFAALSEANIAEGGLFVLTEDLILDEAVTFTNDTEIDLCGNELSLTKKIAVSGNSEVSVINGNVKAEGFLVVEGKKQVIENGIVVEAGSKLTVDGVNYETDGNAIKPVGGAKVVVKDSHIKGLYCVSTNASDTPRGGAVVELIDSEFVSTHSAILLNVPGTLKMNGCTVNGNMHGVIVRGCTAIIKDCTIIQTNDDDGFYNYFDTKNWGDGNTVNLAALTVGDKTAGASYDYPSEVTLVNTALISQSRNPAMYVYGKNHMHTCTNDCSATVNYDAATVAKMQGKVLVEQPSNGTPTELDSEGGSITTKD